MPKVLPGNMLVMSIISTYAPLFFDGMGGISATGIQMALEAEGLVGNRELIKKIISYCTAALKSSNSKDDTNG
jgi:hypothetical protein